MRLVPCCQIWGEVQLRGFTPISWLRFSSLTAPTTTCTASNISAEESCRRIQLAPPHFSQRHV
ncbi:hypothetical protein JZ751_028231 [Albula glossodonta]|uniref:Uncharacterized protein n=1 Tax=Albula glossodonta TaxID=121402 RepID=A0A8T2NCL6_9TELE|nr:hypothetical protein JZ751_028231 [Albula glossodonta]